MFSIEAFLLVAESVLGIDAQHLVSATRLPLAESALLAPLASFDGHDLYENPVDRAAVLASRVIRNHPLPDGNKRVALILMDLYLEQNDYKLTASPQEIDQEFRAVASRTHTENHFMVWLRSRTSPL